MQEIVTSTNRRDFTELVNKKLESPGACVVPGTLSIAMSTCYNDNRDRTETEERYAVVIDVPEEV